MKKLIVIVLLLLFSCQTHKPKSKFENVYIPKYKPKN